MAQRPEWRAASARIVNRLLLWLVVLLYSRAPTLDAQPVQTNDVLTLFSKVVPGIFITAKDSTEEDRRRLNGGVERIIQKGATGPHEVLELVRSITQQHLGENI